jgi:thiamine pyrophosphate-dependent acetolactate synthase large subunit-like protein
MKTLAVFEPAMTFFDPVLVRFAADLKWIEKYGVSVSRHNYGKEPEAFTGNPAVAREMEAGMRRLPVIMVGDQVISASVYPSRQQLAEALGIEAPLEELSPAKALACPCKPWI